MRKRGQLGFDQLVPWLIGLGVLVLVVWLYIRYNAKGGSIIDSLKNFWRFGS